MSCNTHANHAHRHGPGCGHTSVEHEGHIDYLHDGHVHHVHGDHVDEHGLADDMSVKIIESDCACSGTEVT